MTERELIFKEINDAVRQEVEIHFVLNGYQEAFPNDKKIIDNALMNCSYDLTSEIGEEAEFVGKVAFLQECLKQLTLNDEKGLMAQTYSFQTTSALEENSWVEEVPEEMNEN